MQPRQILDTSRPVRPSFTYSIVLLRGEWQSVERYSLQTLVDFAPLSLLINGAMHGRNQQAGTTVSPPEMEGTLHRLSPFCCQSVLIQTDLTLRYSSRCCTPDSRP